jgi:predicted kinase
MTGRVVIFCGIPGTGKTTIGKIVAQELERTVHIQTDIIRSMVTRSTYSGHESGFVYSSAISVARNALRATYDVILDGTFLKQEFREDAVSRVQGLYRILLIVHTHCDLTTAYERNTSRSSEVPLDTFVRMYSNFEPPQSALRIDTGKTSPEGAAEAVLEQLKDDPLDSFEVQRD